MRNYLAIDIGASSGRHILGRVENGKIALEEVYRFDNAQVVRNGHDSWDIERLVASVKAGIDAALALLTVMLLLGGLLCVFCGIVSIKDLKSSD